MTNRSSTSSRRQNCVACVTEECGTRESSEHGECRDTGAESTKQGLFGKKTRHGSKGRARGFIVIFAL
ncbi:unnamed protein product [Oreochromis niloticus]|nr:unnamed protein product [Mustela putorius furo]